MEEQKFFKVLHDVADPGKGNPLTLSMDPGTESPGLSFESEDLVRINGVMGKITGVGIENNIPSFTIHPVSENKTLGEVKAGTLIKIYTRSDPDR